MGFGLTSRLEESGAAGRPRLLGRVARHLSWLVSPEIALDLLTCAAATVLLAYLLDLGKTAVWLGAFVVPIVGREVRHFARDWSRRKRLSAAAILALISGYRQGVLPDVLRRGVEGMRHWVSGQLAPAAAASVLTVGGFAATEAALDRPGTFFGVIRPSPRSGSTPGMRRRRRSAPAGRCGRAARRSS